MRGLLLPMLLLAHHRCPSCTWQLCGTSGAGGGRAVPEYGARWHRGAVQVVYTLMPCAGRLSTLHTLAPYPRPARNQECLQCQTMKTRTFLLAALREHPQVEYILKAADGVCVCAQLHGVCACL